MMVKVIAVELAAFNLIIMTNCGHVHTRPFGWRFSNDWDCFMCDDEENYVKYPKKTDE